MARLAMDQIIAFGEVRRGRLGIIIQDLTPDLARGLRLEVQEGALIAEVLEGSPAQRAALEPGDVIVAVDGEDVASVADLRNKIGFKQVGDSVVLQTLRRGEERTVTVVVGPIGEAE